MDSILHLLKRELHRWCYAVSLRELKDNHRLIQAIERLDELFLEFEITVAE